jgi:polyisoprenoid-binding protein YceI
MGTLTRSVSQIALAAAVSLLATGTASAELTLDSSVSNVTLVSTKVTGDGSSSVAELFRFDELAGAVDGDGNASISIPLNSIDTGVDIRNERMVQFLFETDKYPDAVISASIPDTLSSDGYYSIDLPATLNLRGKISELTIPVAVNVLGNQVTVSSTEPVLLDTNAHDFGAGLAKLAEIAKVFHIPTTVPVSFNLAFTKADS